MEPSIHERLEPFDACFNFRDLGGYVGAAGRRVRWKRVYRSDSLHRFTDEDFARFHRMGPPAVIDLRSSNEIDDFGRLANAREDVDWFHRPIVEDIQLRPQPGDRSAQAGRPEPEAGSRYYDFLGDGAAAVSTLALIADSEGPIVFHCTSGKDRTGMIAAMILDLLGVPDASIALDYVLTQQTRAQALAWIAEHEPDFSAYLDQIPPERRIVREERILGFLGHVRASHVSVEDFVRGAGMRAATLDLLRQQLLEP